jgi:hypothetical protein
VGEIQSKFVASAYFIRLDGLLIVRDFHEGSRRPSLDSELDIPVISAINTPARKKRGSVFKDNGDVNFDASTIEAAVHAVTASVQPAGTRFFMERFMSICKHHIS